jgi:RimJ/RimL family protein N-acetyltransferase
MRLGTEATVLVTPRLTLRPVEIEDTAAVVEVMSPAVTRWLASWPNPMTQTFARERIVASMAATARGGHLWWAVIHQADQRLIGGFGCGLTEADPRRMEISYHLAEAYHGAGYMGEAARAAVAAIWRLFDVDAIEAGAQIENAASFGLMRALGMTPIGERDIYGSARDRFEPCRFYELLRPTD